MDPHTNIVAREHEHSSVPMPPSYHAPPLIKMARALADGQEPSEPGNADAFAAGRSARFATSRISTPCANAIAMNSVCLPPTKPAGGHR